MAAAAIPACTSLSAVSPIGANAIRFSPQLSALRSIRCSRLAAFRPQRRHYNQESPLRFRCSASLEGNSTSSDHSTSSNSPKTARINREPKPKPPKSFGEKALALLEQQAGLLWLLGPVVATTAVILPTISLSLVDLLRKNFFLGLGAVFAMDLIYVLAADAFFVFADKCGHQQTLPGDLPPWIAPWELAGYPKGLPQVWDYTTYVGIGGAALALLLAVVVGKFGVAVAAFAPYLALIFVQGAYERLLCRERLPTYPLVAMVYAMYRFRQLGRAMELFGAFGAGPAMVGSVRVLMAVWTFYLATYLSQLPWLYCTWNANRVS